MAIISLRAYNREIESLIERGQFEQAIFHCRQILQYFPKHLDTYRFLGKTYLESQRYSDAADIFQRVLSSVPDDFVSHVGLSIIREDEGNLDDAIWHMERAFETQPANSAIQGELRRLRNKRDGYDAPRARLTRSALARMYMKGELYPQAIAELRAALTEDPKRLDLKVLLGTSYFRAGQKAEAAEICSAVLQKLPQCLEANRILEQILSNTERTEEARACRERVQALDPYYAHTTTARPDPAQINDDAVVLEKGVFQPGRVTGPMGPQPDWAASLGVNVEGLAPQNQEMPEWLSAAVAGAASPEESKAEAPESEAGPVDQSQELIPDWLKDAGWSPSSDEAREAEADLFTDEPLDEQPLQAEIPAWLKAMAPEEAQKDFLAGEQQEAESALTGERHLTAKEPSDEDLSARNLNAELDMGDLNIQPGQVPDWLKSLGEEEPRQIAEDEAGSQAALPEAEPADLPDWLQELEHEPESDMPARVSHTPGEEVPDWLKDFEDASPPIEEFETPKSSASVPDEEKTGEDWLKKLADAELPLGSTTPEAERERQPLDSAAEVSQTVSPFEDEDEAFAWLEGLAARQGAAEDELLLSPEDRRAAPPEWLAESEEPVGKEQPWEVPSGSPGMTARLEFPDEEAQPASESELPDWLKNASQAPKPETPVQAGAEYEAPPVPAFDEIEAAEEGELPDWLKEMEAEQEPELEPAAEFAAPTPAFEAAEAAEEAELPDWLKEMEAEQAPELEPAAELEAPVPAFDEIEAADEAELPDWLKEMEAEQEPELEPAAGLAAPTPAFEAAEAAEEGELPDWLKEMEVEQEPELEPAAGLAALAPAFEQTEAAEEAEMPEWLKEMEAEQAPDLEPELEPTAELAAPVPAFDEIEAAEEAELPEWLKEMETEQEPELEPAAELAAAAPAFDETGTAEEAGLPDWLLEMESELEPDQVQKTWPDEEPPLIEGDTRPAKTRQVEQPVSAEIETLAGLVPSDEEAESVPAAELPDWLKEMEAEQAPEIETAAGLEAPTPAFEQTEAAEEAELPEWLKEMEAEQEPELEPAAGLEAPTPAFEQTEAAEEAELPDWLKEMEAEQAPELETAAELAAPVLAFEETEAAEVPSVPDWLQDSEAELEEETAAEEISSEVGQLAESEALFAEEPFETPAIVEVVGGAKQAGEQLVESDLTAETEALLDELAVETPTTIEAGADQLEAEAASLAAEVEKFEPVEAGAEPAAALTSEDDAFAWLESLAARQGAKEEELLVAPEERTERPPDWLKKVLDTGELPPLDTSEPGLPPFMETRAVTEDEIEEISLEAELEAAPAEAPVQETSAAEMPEEVEAIAELEQELAEMPGLGGEQAALEAEPETALEAEPETEITAAGGEKLPELPDWLQDLEGETAIEEETTWQPPVVAAPQPELIDINAASLKELERLPGVGFIRAQALIEYRQIQGPLSGLDELILVEGFDADLAASLKDYAQVQSLPAPEAAQPPVVLPSGQAQTALMQARNDLVQDNLQSALQKYLGLIEAEELLSDVVHDLHEAVYRNPEDVDIWQALGDAHLRAGSIQEALNAYTRAEELLR